MDDAELFALLDDRDATAERPTSRLYTGYAHERRCDDPALLDAVWRAVEADQQAGLHAVVLIDYEWGTQLVGAGQREDVPGALRVLLFRQLERLSAEAVGEWLAAREDGCEPGPASVLGVKPSIGRDAFHAAIRAIHEAIRAGETYQVNFTYRLGFSAHGTPLALYRRLRARQPVPFGAFIALPPGGARTHVLSCSPELFIRHAGGCIAAKPMKGTAPRRRVLEGDSETARHLGIDAKNRAENLMIVDLLRNDLGRIATIGSVKVPELFAVESHATLFQMTSTVEAELAPQIDFPALLRATFPCGSITGAPKHQTMGLIGALESTPRGLYTGAIGWVDRPADGVACGDFCLSVAIRTLLLGAEDDGLRPGVLGIGAGIVLDSEAEDEYQECQLKGRFLTGLPACFTLFETMHASREGGVRHLERHLQRIQRSAEALGFAWPGDTAAARLRTHAAGLPPGLPARMKLVLHADGQIDTVSTPLKPLPEGAVRLRLAAHALSATRPLAGHKSSLRRTYDDGVRAAEADGAFDTLFFTPSGRLVEGGRSNVFVKIDGRWRTPPLGDGALPGVMRGLLLDDPAWDAVEQSITREELLRAEAVVVCNALRGALTAELA